MFVCEHDEPIVGQQARHLAHDLVNHAFNTADPLP